MSVTIVSALPPTNSVLPSSGVETAAAGSGGAIGLDFASILLGKNLTELSPETAAPEETASMLGQTDPLETDATAILATLGLATQQPASTATQAEPTDADAAGPDASASLAQIGAGPGIASEKSVKTEAIPTAANPALGTTARSDDAPAKFAAAAAPIATENATIAEPAAKGDEQARTISTLASHPAATAQRDAPLAVHAHVRDQSWSSEFSQKIVWLANADKQSAQLTLNPPQMGPIEISLNVEKGSASASFISANQEVRDAIETALPRLREMFASAGIQLGHTNVSSESFRQQGENPANLARPQGGGDNGILADSSGESLTGRAFLGRAANGLVDLFA